MYGHIDVRIAESIIKKRRPLQYPGHLLFREPSLLGTLGKFVGLSKGLGDLRDEELL